MEVSERDMMRIHCAFNCRLQIMTGDETGAFFQEILPSGDATSERDAPPAMKTLSDISVVVCSEYGGRWVLFWRRLDAFFAGRRRKCRRFGDRTNYFIKGNRRSLLIA